MAVAVAVAESRCYRGSCLPEEFQTFYKPGTKYRLPGFLATSFDIKVCTTASFAVKTSPVAFVSIWYLYDYSDQVSTLCSALVCALVCYQYL